MEDALLEEQDTLPDEYVDLVTSSLSISPDSDNEFNLHFDFILLYTLFTSLNENEYVCFIFFNFYLNFHLLNLNVSFHPYLFYYYFLDFYLLVQNIKNSLININDLL